MLRLAMAIQPALLPRLLRWLLATFIFVHYHHRDGAVMRERGFSIIELLIVVAIILVISAIAIPNLLHSKIAANESSAVYSIRTINTAQVTYASTYPTTGYASTLNSLASAIAAGPVTSSNAGILDWVLGCTGSGSGGVCPKSGYNFQLTDISGSPVSAYSVWGVPISVGTTGYRTFCSNNMNPVLFDPAGGPADSGNCTQALQ
jgi:prepilin-type N-terminal cleavage/methylation domain-containing protein